MLQFFHKYSIFCLYVTFIHPLNRLIHAYSPVLAQVLPYSLRDCHPLVLDLSANNGELNGINLNDTPAFTKYVFNKMAGAGTPVAIGGYNEDRVIYRKRATFSGEEPRSIHLGIDLWTKAGTPVFLPLDGKIHSFKDNRGFGDYGPTIIVEHCLENVTFFTLYGHLDMASLSSVSKGKHMRAGEKIGNIGNYPVNGDWPPHLHFQVITHMQGYEGDFPGVAAPSQKDFYLNLCPDPAFILGIADL